MRERDPAFTNGLPAWGHPLPIRRHHDLFNSGNPGVYALVLLGIFLSIAF